MGHTLQNILWRVTTKALVAKLQVILYSAGVNALEIAIEKVGGQSALARAIGGSVRQQHVWHWLNVGGGRVPAEYCGAIEHATAGDVSRHDLRPDVFGVRSNSEAA